MRVTLFLAAITLSAVAAPSTWSQHGGGASGHGMASGHLGGGPVGLGGHAAPWGGTGAARSTSARPAALPSRALGPARSFNQSDGYGGNWTSSGFIPSHSGHDRSGQNPNHQGRDRNEHDRNRHLGYGYGYGAVAFPFYGYGDAFADNDFYGDAADDPNQQPANGYGDNAPPPYLGTDDRAYAGYPTASAQAEMGSEMQDEIAAGARAPYNPGGDSQSAKPSGDASDGLGHPKVTLIFKDGRAPLQIQNYALSQTKVLVRDQAIDRDIAISDLDVPATRAANDQAGVDFELPVQR